MEKKNFFQMQETNNDQQETYQDQKKLLKKQKILA